MGREQYIEKHFERFFADDLSQFNPLHYKHRKTGKNITLTRSFVRHGEVNKKFEDDLNTILDNI